MELFERALKLVYQLQLSPNANNNLLYKFICLLYPTFLWEKSGKKTISGAIELHRGHSGGPVYKVDLLTK